MKLKLILVALALLAACNRTSQDPDAVKQGINTHLSKVVGLNLEKMDIAVTSVTFRENEADAVVSIQPKGSTDAANAMSMKYTLQKKDGQWVVKGRAGGGASNPHGGTMPPAGGGAAAPADTPGAAMPPGHPPMPSSPEPKK